MPSDPTTAPALLDLAAQAPFGTVVVLFLLAYLLLMLAGALADRIG